MLNEASLPVTSLDVIKTLCEPSTNVCNFDGGIITIELLSIIVLEKSDPSILAFIVC